MRLDESSLPVELGPFDAVEAAYPGELSRAHSALTRRLPALVECDKELTPFFYKCLRDRLKQSGLRCVYLDGRPPADANAMQMPSGVVGMLLVQLRDVVRGAVGDRIVVLPHLDLLTTSQTGLTSEAREVISLLYENPDILWLGFKDPSFLLPRVIENLFAHRESIIGIARERLAHLVTQREARKFGRGLDPYALYKYVSGVNAIRLRRLLSSLDGEDYPADPERVMTQLRSATVSTDLSLPNIDLDNDIGGYQKVKDRLRHEILDILARKDAIDEENQVKFLEGLLPRGMIFCGPPGTGKTLFAKAMASSLGAAVSVVSGPELKSRWVGESEERIRQVFIRARQSAPSVIIFDELDSFATARGTYTGSGVEHSMVNQMLTEMDGFRSDELVFVVGTTNFVESLDPALLRPGRFEFTLEIPFPGADDRRAILEIYNKSLGLQMSVKALDHAVKRTGEPVESTGGRHSGDHIQALCRAIARRRIREGITGATEVEHLEATITEHLDRPELTSAEERVVATHEAGHAVCALLCENAPPIERISIRGDIGGALGFVSYGDHAHRHVISHARLLDIICVLFGGREAEDLIVGDLSIGSAHDLDRATRIARDLVTEYGMGEGDVGVRAIPPTGPHDVPHAPATLEKVDTATKAILEEQRHRARRILEDNRTVAESLRDLLIERKVVDREALASLTKSASAAEN